MDYGSLRSRRLANLWFLFGCVVCFKTGQICDASQSYRVIQLPCTKAVWQASTQSAWEAEYEASRSSQACGFATLGDLIDAQRSFHMPSVARKLDIWNAGVDNLGALLNLAGTIV